MISMLDEMNPELDRLVIRLTIEYFADSNSPITYGLLAKKVEMERGSKMSAQGFAYSLGRIQNYCAKLDLPCLSVMVTDNNFHPGNGFIEPYRELHPKSKELSEKEIIRAEKAAALACKDWQKLYDFAEIEDPVPVIRDRLAEREMGEVYKEGKRVQKQLATEIERNPQAREQCLALKGTRCSICGESSNEKYGVPGVIHVHHLNPIHESVGQRAVDPEKDLIPVCPNCHAVIHSKSPCYSPEEVQTLLRAKSKPNNDLSDVSL